MEKVLKILMLEDSTEDAEMIQRLLRKEKMDCEYCHVMVKDEFLAALDNFAPEIILSDHSLPQFNSSKALTIAREKIPEIPFILVTGAVSEEFAAEIIKQGADDYILKDRMTRLPAAIKAAILKRMVSKEIIDYKYALDQSAIVAITDQRGIIQYANENFCKISKYSLEELIGKDHRIINSGYHPKNFIKDLWTTIANGKNWKGELCNKAKDGSIYWVDTSIVPFLNNQGKPYQYIAIRQDITERKKAEDELRQSEIRLKEAQTVAHIANWEFDFPGNKLSWSDELFSIFGLNKAEVQPSIELFLSFINSDDSAEAEKLVNGALANFTDSKIDFRFRLLDGKKRYGHIEWRFEFDDLGNPTRVYGILQDITARKEAERNVKLLEKEIQTQKQLEEKLIARAVLTGQEKERNYISRELHDNVNQILVGTKLHLSHISQKDERIKELIQYPLELINLSIDEIRQLCHNLISPQKSIHFKEMIENLIYNLSKNSGIKSSLSYSVEDDLLEDDLQLNLYRIIQELLNNISKYAEASSFEIQIHASAEYITLTVTDDGKGFNTKKQRSGIGISNIIYRAECFNGKVTIKSSPGKGCKVHVKIPYLK